MKKNLSGEGSLYYSKSRNRWVIQYTEPITKKKKQIVQKKNETEKDFRKKYHKLINEINEDEYIAGSKLTIASIAKENIENLYRANKIKTVTYNRKYDTYREMLQLDIATMPIQKVTVKQINDSLVKLSHYSNSVLSKIYAMISNSYEYAVAYDIVRKNPFKIKNLIIKPKSVKPDKEIEAFTVEQQKAFEQELNKCNDYYKPVFYILLYTGMRVGEVLALTGDDIDLENKVIHVRRTLTKGKNDEPIIGKTTKTYSGQRDVPIIDKLLPLLPTKIENKLLFTYNGKIIKASTINDHFKKICKYAGINIVIKNNKKKKNRKGEEVLVNLKTSNVNTHMLRHTFATRCIEAGMSAVALSKILGHKDIQTTLNIYTSVFEKYQKSELEKVEKYLNNL